MASHEPNPAHQTILHNHAPSRARRVAAWVLGLAVALGVLALTIRWLIEHSHAQGEGHEPAAAESPPLWGIGVIPFVGILGAIAMLPLIRFTHHWWESNFNRLILAMVMAGATVVYYAAALGADSIEPMLQHAVVGEYVPFIALLFALYVISGGISLQGNLAAHPTTNTAFLATGAIIASFVGTTGASMLLIRPLLQTNSARKHVTHTVVFFIFLVSNIGGCLLPIGDPPLFLGYLRGVPFLWTLNLWPAWAMCNAILLIVYYFWDRAAYKRERLVDITRDESIHTPLRLRGGINLIYLLGVVLAVWQLVPGAQLLGTDFVVFPFMRELVMLALVGLSLTTSPAGIRKENAFNYIAITEVAVLFLGIFITMQVPVMVLQAEGAALGLNQAWQFFWTTGALSSFLDNAPTYVVFFETASGMPAPASGEVLGLAKHNVIRSDLLVAISLGAVFMGAMTYIGNGPNFMVKSIAEQSNVRMPSFFGFVFRYSAPILIPLFILVTLVFLL